MKKKLIKAITSGLAGIMIVGSVYIPSDGMTLFYANKGRRNTKVFVEAKFTPNVKTTSTEYGLKKGKYVKKVTIRLKEGSYNKTKSDTKGYLIKLEKTNNPMKTSSGSWSWTYK